MNLRLLLPWIPIILDYALLCALPRIPGIIILLPWIPGIITLLPWILPALTAPWILCHRIINSIINLYSFLLSLTLSNETTAAIFDITEDGDFDTKIARITFLTKQY
jgi:hypothetical protein